MLTATFVAGFVLLLLFCFIRASRPYAPEEPPLKVGPQRISIGEVGHVLRCLNGDTFIFEPSGGDVKMVCLDYIHTLIRQEYSEAPLTTGGPSPAQLKRMQVLSMWFSANHHPEVDKNGDIIIVSSGLSRTGPCKAGNCQCT